MSLEYEYLYLILLTTLQTHKPASPKQMEILDFEYDNGYGGQVLHGTIWMDDDTWVDRGEYDGSEWWKWNFLPDIPKYLQENSEADPKK